MPPLEQILGKCIWQGEFGNCAALFSLQRTEGGFCYSFNSLTSEESRHCRRWERQQPDGALAQRRPCAVRHSLASGPTTGLELMLSDVPRADKIIPEQRDHDGFRVLVQNVQQPPESARGLLVARRRGHTMKLLLRAALTDSRRHLLRLGARQRGCLFASEASPLLAAHYSFKACLMDCRLRHVLRLCRCTPYYFNHVPDYPTCNLSMIWCIASIDRHLRFYRVDGGGGGGGGEEGALNCSWCLPDCRLFEYGVDARYEANPGMSADSYVDVYYSESAAVFYLRELTFDAAQLIVSFGGILSLFLGVSVLSLAELPHLALRLIAAVYRGATAHQAHVATSHQTHVAWLRHHHSPDHSGSTASEPRSRVFRGRHGTASATGLRTRKGRKWLGRRLAQLPLFASARRLESVKIAAVGARQELSCSGAALPQRGPHDAALW